MKKVIIILAIIASAWGSLQAQDTIWQRPAPLSNYYTNYWIDTTANYGPTWGWQGIDWIYARRFVTEDTLQVYGIAAIMVESYWLTRHFHSPSDFQNFFVATYPEDPTTDNLKEWFMLFQYSRDGDSAVMEQLGDSMMVHYQQPPTYYLKSSASHYTDWTDTIPKPVYERYFTTPQTVHDTFYAGITETSWKYNDKVDEGFWDDQGYWYHYREPFHCLDYYNGLLSIDTSAEEYVACQRKESRDSPESWWVFQHRKYGTSLFIFPILTPEPVIDTTVNPGTDTTVTPGGDTIITPGGDTTYYGGDTVAMGDTLVVTDTIVIGGDTIVTSDTILTVREHDMLWNLTVVTPNPARGVAKVVASPGLTRVEAYNAAGAKLLDSPATGFSLSIDVGSWPSGTYLLRIHTPVGVTVKKLLVNGR